MRSASGVNIAPQRAPSEFKLFVVGILGGEGNGIPSLLAVGVFIFTSLIWRVVVVCKIILCGH